ncbi:AraC family transcriptional regulator [Actinoplanes sp. TRM 88003]|uniref:AraC family transcriptional regulator n=1 Tax=Paractinoplanes aksuensis TaxID=2939490 RepID=A0ABT1DIA8_9ACTN|nr:AraC family transcriptional regulator [Actinoplanes aksuensis]MCO8269800.1 AraC family transcriptional regulator [Actinoplanes aksuensis]
MRLDETAQPPISRFEFATHDIGAAHDVLRQIYANHTFRIHRTAEKFVYRHTAVDAGLIKAVRVTYTMDVTVDFQPTDNLIFVALANGRVDTHDGRAVTRTGPGDVQLHRPGRPLTNHCRDFDMFSINLNPSVVADVASARTGIAPHDVRFDGSAPVSKELGRYWWDTMAYLHGFLTGPPGPAQSPLAVSAAADLAATAALVTFPNTTMATPDRPVTGPPAPASVRRAVSYIESHAGEPITAAWIAEAARVTPRALQAAFRRHLDTTPMAYLRRVRLSRAHRDLVEADPTAGDTVAAIAHRWGYLSLSHFAADYRAAYGRTPRQTLIY